LCEHTEEIFKLEQLKKIFDSTFLESHTMSPTLCNTDEKLLLEDEETVVDCQTFFESKIQQQGRPTTLQNLFKIYRNPFDFNYLGIVKISDDQELYIEFASKEKVSRLQNALKANNYSVAYYDQSELVKQIGTFVYPLMLSETNTQSNKAFFDYERFEHLCVFANDSSNEKVLIVSQKIPNTRDRLSTFSFVFILCLLLGLLWLLFQRRTFRLLFESFAQRLQLTILGIVLSTFVVIGATSIVYVQRLNAQKNQKVLREKTHSLLLLMEQRFGDKTPEEIHENSALLQRKLTEFSEVFFTDIFFYDATGHILEKSSIEEALQSSSRDVMDAQAYHQLSQEHKNFYIQKETMGGEVYHSSYVPFRNYRNELVGYLNLPHFAKQTELRQEISAFVMAYINLFIVLIILAFMLVYLILKRLTKPLVESERQIAWNEMAKQIAHEIKNPLTPMRLNVQQIQKAWNDQKDDFDDRIKHFSTVMVEQIDTLSAIASEFATFAQQPNVELVEVNVKHCLEKAILLMNTDQIIQFEPAENTYQTTILADEKQLSRALVNMIKNAKQAVSEVENPHITVSLSHSENTVVIAIQDNGKGIPPEIHNRIFEPSFTTKTSGMGLGLAITKNIIERFNGVISFETNENGTVFFVMFATS
jgi:signal transduction histidine kinase